MRAFLRQNFRSRGYFFGVRDYLLEDVLGTFERGSEFVVSVYNGAFAIYGEFIVIVYANVRWEMCVVPNSGKS